MTVQAWLLRAVENLLIAGFVVMIAMVFGNVVLRYGFNSGITVSEEASRMIFVWLTFGGAFLVAKDGGHLGMTTVVTMLGRNGRWWCRLAAEGLSLLCMVLVVIGCWKQSVINIDNIAPVTGIPMAITYIAGLVCGTGIAALNLISLAKLLTGRIPDNELIIGTESEELAAFEAKQAEERRS
ncbi:TRAP transporter small permease [Bosea sp. (in: a-proteobacteria)]|jgi:TRAP-type C4-dicarboxylate transport system permease small subunit|uniref:TRAP transporter small permease n=1 Tax=Bosea sp. (in: a-proteobacteria) TaxID=1871050 RepID=UPI003F709EE3